MKILICFLHFLVRKDKATFHPCPADFAPWETHCFLHAPFRNKFSTKGCGGDQKFSSLGWKAHYPSKTLRRLKSNKLQDPGLLSASGIRVVTNARLVRSLLLLNVQTRA